MALSTFDNTIDLDVVIRMYSTSFVDLDTEVNSDRSSVNFTDYDIQTSLLYDTNSEGELSEMTATRLTLPAGDGSRLGYMSPTTDVRKVKEDRVRTGEDEGSDDYLGHYVVTPGSGRIGTTNVLLMKSSSGIRKFTLPDTPIVLPDKQVYNADDLFSLVRADHINGSEACTLIPINVISTNIADPVVKLFSINEDAWREQGYADLWVKFNPNEIYITKVEARSDLLDHINTEATGFTISDQVEQVETGFTVSGRQNEMLVLHITWDYFTAYEREVVLKGAGFVLHIEYDDLRYATKGLEGEYNQGFYFRNGMYDEVGVLSSSFTGSRPGDILTKSVSGLFWPKILDNLISGIPGTYLVGVTTSTHNPRPSIMPYFLGTLPESVKSITSMSRSSNCSLISILELSSRFASVNTPEGVYILSKNHGVEAITSKCKTISW